MHDVSTVRNWITKAEAEVSDLAREAERTQVRLVDSRRRLMMLYEILATLTNSPVPIATNAGGSSSIREQVLANAERILREHGSPMRIQDIHAEFIRRGMFLPGRGTPTNIQAHLGTSERFPRIGRGIYGLAEWDSASRSANVTSAAGSPWEEETSTALRNQAH